MRSMKWSNFVRYHTYGITIELLINIEILINKKKRVYFQYFPFFI